MGVKTGGFSTFTQPSKLPYSELKSLQKRGKPTSLLLTFLERCGLLSEKNKIKIVQIFVMVQVNIFPFLAYCASPTYEFCILPLLKYTTM